MNLIDKVATLRGKWVKVVPYNRTGILVKLFEQKMENGFSWEVIEIENSEGSHYIIVGEKTDIIEIIK